MSVKVCTYHYCEIHGTCLFKNATAVLKNHPRKRAIGTKVNANIIICYEKDGFDINTDGYDYIPPSTSVVTKKQISKSKLPLARDGKTPIQPLPITIDNFFVSTYGIFDEIKQIPEGFSSFFKSRGSEYYSNAGKQHLIRVSNHWGLNINLCSWHLKGHRKTVTWEWQKKYGKHERIGLIKFTDFKINPTVFKK